MPGGAAEGLLLLARRINTQERGDRRKVYSVHEPLVECIAKGKAGKKYEFGNKVSLAVISRKSWVVRAMSLRVSAYDGHTLKDQMVQVRGIFG